MLAAVMLAACGDAAAPIVDAAMPDGAGDGGHDEDAAAIDAAAIDGSAIDGSAIDGSAIDAASIDASTIDAPVIDALATDAPVIDAPLIDALAIDALAIDAPVVDAPAVDAALCPIGMNDLVPATLTVTTDDNTKIWLNGALISDSVHIWSSPQQYTVMIYRHPSRTNVLALEGVNLFNQAGYDRGILADLRVVVDGAPQTIVTDTSWRVTNTLAAGWEAPGFDDSGWAAPFNLGAHGIAPWGAVFSSLAPGTTASWIWTYDPAAVVNKPQNESTYARRRWSVIDPPCMPTET